MTLKQLISILLISFLSLTLSSCSEDNGADEPKGDPATDIIKSVTSESITIETYISNSSIDGVMQMIISDNEGQSADISIEMTGSISTTIDNVAKEMISKIVMILMQ